MGKADYLSLGEWNVKCDRCGFKFKSGMLKKTWDDLMVCSTCYEVRHPQDFVRGVPDNQNPPWVRPDPAPTFIAFCTPAGRTALADYAMAGCSVCGTSKSPGFPT